MARPTLVLDASVGVKWFSPQDEQALKQALAIRNAHVSEQILVIVPDLFYYEVTNALVQKKFFSTGIVRSAGSSLFDLGLSTVNLNDTLLDNAIRISRQSAITVYDAIYAAVAAERGSPLVTANPRHQRPGLGCRVIPVEEWQQRFPSRPSTNTPPPP